MLSVRQSHSVSQKSGNPPTVASVSPSGEKRPHAYDLSVPPRIIFLSFIRGYSYTYTFGSVPFSPTARMRFDGCTHTMPTPLPSTP
eukprot:29053-Pelagococcus_subviridis.AAC.7